MFSMPYCYIPSFPHLNLGQWENFAPLSNTIVGIKTETIDHIIQHHLCNAVGIP
jgi:hypothetical protein